MRELPAQQLRGSLLSSIYASQEHRPHRGKRSSIVGSQMSKVGFQMSQDLSEIMPSPYSKARRSRKDFIKRFGSIDSETAGEEHDQVQTVVYSSKLKGLRYAAGQWQVRLHDLEPAN